MSRRIWRATEFARHGVKKIRCPNKILPTPSPHGPFNCIIRRGLFAVWCITHHSCTQWPEMRRAVVILLWVSIQFAWIVRFYGISTDTNISAPLLEAVVYYEVDWANNFHQESIYRGTPTPELELAWDRLWRRKYCSWPQALENPLKIPRTRYQRSVKQTILTQSVCGCKLETDTHTIWRRRRS
jgi:hypothetical protein